MMKSQIKIGLAIAVAALCAGNTARADLQLTAAGIADGFSLSTYASQGGTGNYYYLGASVLPDGNLAVIQYAGAGSDGVNKFADVNGQTPGSALAHLDLGGAVNSTNLNGTAYVDTLNGSLYSITSNLTPTLIPINFFGTSTSYNFGYGLWGSNVAGLIYNANYGNGIYAINVGAGTATLVLGSDGKFFDGVSVSPDGKTVYGEANGHVYGYDTTTGLQVFDYASGNQPDGTAVIAGGTYNGYVIANNNDGTVTLITPDGSSGVLIASGGSRGDFASPDSNNGSLLLAEYDVLYRLQAPNGSFSATPEPATIVSAGMAAAVMGVFYGMRRLKAK